MPTDCAAVFRLLAKTLGGMLETEPLLHDVIATGLAVMIENFVHVVNDPQQRPADIQVMCHYARRAQDNMSHTTKPLNRGTAALSLVSFS